MQFIVDFLYIIYHQFEYKQTYFYAIYQSVQPCQEKTVWPVNCSGYCIWPFLSQMHFQKQPLEISGLWTVTWSAHECVPRLANFMQHDAPSIYFGSQSRIWTPRLSSMFLIPSPHTPTRAVTTTKVTYIISFYSHQTTWWTLTVSRWDILGSSLTFI